MKILFVQETQTREVQVNREVQTGIQVGRHTNRHVYRWTGIQIRDLSVPTRGAPGRAAR